MILAADLVERIVISGLVKLFPRSRERILVRWIIGLRKLCFGISSRVGGARFDIEVTVPCVAGELIVINHQSLLDIPVVFATVPDAYPRVVTRASYGKGVPLISHMLRLYRHLLVRPGGDTDFQMRRLEEFARGSEHPVVIFPEGHRTRDGEILRWKKGGLRTVLRARKWRVHVLTLDGLWKSLSLMEFMRNISKVECRVVEADCFEFDPQRDDVDAVILRMREAMCAKLAEMRGTSTNSDTQRGAYGAQPDIAK